MPSFRSIKISYSSPPAPAPPCEEPSPPPPLPSPPPPPSSHSSCSPCQHKNHTPPPPPPPPTTSAPPPPPPPPPPPAPGASSPPPPTPKPGNIAPPPRAPKVVPPRPRPSTPAPFYPAIAPSSPYFAPPPGSLLSLAPTPPPHGGGSHTPLGVGLGGLFFLSFIALGLNYFLAQKAVVPGGGGGHGAPPSGGGDVHTTFNEPPPAQPGRNAAVRAGSDVPHVDNSSMDAPAQGSNDIGTTPAASEPHNPRLRPAPSFPTDKPEDEAPNNEPSEEAEDEESKERKKKFKGDTLIQRLTDTRRLLSDLVMLLPPPASPHLEPSQHQQQEEEKKAEAGEDVASTENKEESNKTEDEGDDALNQATMLQTKDTSEETTEKERDEADRLSRQAVSNDGKTAAPKKTKKKQSVAGPPPSQGVKSKNDDLNRAAGLAKQIDRNLLQNFDPTPDAHSTTESGDQAPPEGDDEEEEDLEEDDEPNVNKDGAPAADDEEANKKQAVGGKVRAKANKQTPKSKLNNLNKGAQQLNRRVRHDSQVQSNREPEGGTGDTEKDDDDGNLQVKSEGNAIDKEPSQKGDEDQSETNNNGNEPAENQESVIDDGNLDQSWLEYVDLDMGAMLGKGALFLSGWTSKVEKLVETNSALVKQLHQRIDKLENVRSGSKKKDAITVGKPAAAHKFMESVEAEATAGDEGQEADNDEHSTLPDDSDNTNPELAARDCDNEAEIQQDEEKEKMASDEEETPPSADPQVATAELQDADTDSAAAATASSVPDGELQTHEQGQNVAADEGEGAETNDERRKGNVKVAGNKGKGPTSTATASSSILNLVMEEGKKLATGDESTEETQWQGEEEVLSFVDKKSSALQNEPTKGRSDERKRAGDKNTKSKRAQLHQTNKPEIPPATISSSTLISVIEGQEMVNIDDRQQPVQAKGNMPTKGSAAAEFNEEGKEDASPFTDQQEDNLNVATAEFHDAGAATASSSIPEADVETDNLEENQNVVAESETREEMNRVKYDERKGNINPAGKRKGATATNTTTTTSSILDIVKGEAQQMASGDDTTETYGTVSEKTEDSFLQGYQNIPGLDERQVLSSMAEKVIPKKENIGHKRPVATDNKVPKTAAQVQPGKGNTRGGAAAKTAVDDMLGNDPPRQPSSRRSRTSIPRTQTPGFIDEKSPSNPAPPDSETTVVEEEEGGATAAAAAAEEEVVEEETATAVAADAEEEVVEEETATGEVSQSSV